MSYDDSDSTMDFLFDPFQVTTEYKTLENFSTITFPFIQLLVPTAIHGDVATMMFPCCPYQIGY